MEVYRILILHFLFTAILGLDSGQRPAISENGRYIVKLKAQTSTDTFLHKLTNTLDDSSISVLHRYEKVLKGFSAQLSETAVKLLTKFDEVDYIEAEVTFSSNQNLPWNIDRIDQISIPVDGLYEPIGTGDGIDVYIVDSGIYSDHEDYEGRAEAAYDALGGNGADCNGHGSHCAGLVGGVTYGVAKATNLKGVRVLDCDGDGQSGIILDGLEWIMTQQSPAVVSVSFSGSGSDAMDDAIRNMISSGFIVVASSGNNQEDACSFSPGRVEEVITVAATDQTDTRAYFSNYGTCVDVFAPGVNITSVWIGGEDATNILSGTSLASPHVAGVAAIILSENNMLSPYEVKDAIVSRASIGVVLDPGVGSPNRFLYIGAGEGPNTPPTGSECSFTITDDSVDVQSPNFPANYGNNEDCTYLITAPEGYIITLTFDTFHVEEDDTCQYDYLEVYDSSYSMAQYKIGSYCGNDIPGPFISTGSNLFMIFKSDPEFTAEGFQGDVVFNELLGDCSCEGTCDLIAREFNSPNYPNEYENSATCNYQFTAPPGNIIRIDWLDFNVEQTFTGGGCFDSITVYDGADDTYPVIDELCGTSPPDPVFSSGNEVFLVFSTDSSVTRRGFDAIYTPLSATPTSPVPTPENTPTSSSVSIPTPEYTTVAPGPEECPCPDTCDLTTGEFNSPNYPDPYESNSFCEYSFSVSPDKAVMVTWIDFDVEQGILGPCFDSVTLYDGVDDTYPELGVFCGDILPETVVTSQSNIHIVFRSDNVVNRNGFLAVFNETEPPIISTPPPSSECGNDYTDENTIVTSPGHPGNYPRNSNCGNTITAPVGQRVEFTFLTMDIEVEEYCSFDSVQLFDGTQPNQEQSLSPPLCGDSLPVDNPFTSTGNTMFVLFLSDVSRQQSGFTASLRFI